MNTRKVGAEYEQKAAAFLEEKGFRILERNYRCRSGEIDLIAHDGYYLVFVEVKYRHCDVHGSPLQAVDHKKQRRISKAAAYYLYSRKYAQDTPCRFDVVGILDDEIIWIENAFPYCGSR